MFAPNTIEYKEYLKLILLNQAVQVLGITTISEGGMNKPVIDVRLILQTALLTHSSSITIAHNHPAGTTNPNKQDDASMHRIKKEAAKLMDITLCDHLIVCEDNYYSYADERRL